MGDPGIGDGGQEPDDAALAERTRRRLDEVFGDVLPEVTRDEQPDGREGQAPGDEWLRANRPPHHGG